MTSIRRVVTGHDENGKAVILLDGPAPNSRVRKSGLVSTLAWVTDETPARVSDTDRADREIGTAPQPSGTVFRIVDFPPVNPHSAETLSQEAILREMGIAHDAGHAPARHPFMHRTKSIDYAMVLCGEIDMMLDDSEVHLTAGDLVIQQGTNHAWVNNGKATCRIAFVLIDAEEPNAWKKR
jgi:hypothetical protein